jgi:signal transduction histidine kinase
MRLTRLRWQLTLSHLVAIAFTLVLMVAATVLIWSGWAAIQSDPIRDTAQDARIVARAVDDLVTDGAARADLDSVLRSLASGRLGPFGGGPFPPEPGRRGDFPAPVLRNLAYATVVGPDGAVLGSSDPAGAAFSPPERSDWDGVLRAALAGERDPRRLVLVRSGSTPVALGAAPIVDDDGRAVAAVVVAKSALPAPDRVGSFWRALAVFSAATVALLGVAFVFALASASLLGYLLSRRLVARLERLGRAAEGLAAGDLDRRVEEGPPDEVGQLARRFNTMAGRLAATVTELEARQDQAEALLRAKRELIANVSHELRTPLATIRGYTESLLMDGRRGGSLEPSNRSHPDADGLRQSLAVIHRETEQLSRLIDDLFLLSTAEAGALELTIRPVALGEVVAGVADGLRPVARRERGVTVVTESDPGLPPALADRERVVQVVSNLARNAVRHTPEGGLVALRAGRRDGLAVVTVEDTGVGIPPDQLAHVFERFYRGDDARDRSSGGAGLGLAIVRELVEAMGGAVSAESTLGQGSRFSFTLPLAPPTEGAVSTAGGVAAGTGSPVA